MIRLENLYSFMESSFDYLLVVDGGERVVHASRLLVRNSLSGAESTPGKPLQDILTPSSLATFRSAMAQARDGNRATAVLTRPGKAAASIHLQAGCGYTDGGDVFVFFGNRLKDLHKAQDWEKDERIKELSCLYDVAEWLEESGSIEEFFAGLSRIISVAMLYPGEAIVHSSYEGAAYGQESVSSNCISARIVVGGR
ncbi:MAG: hypothetical protein IH611_09065, partial [Deltaproteobacteria bacterium]|nr:hypothetical protein [Deltaproteobacteria bacterium]